MNRFIQRREKNEAEDFVDESSLFPQRIHPHKIQKTVLLCRPRGLVLPKPPNLSSVLLKPRRHPADASAGLTFGT